MGAAFLMPLRRAEALQLRTRPLVRPGRRPRRRAPGPGGPVGAPAAPGGQRRPRLAGRGPPPRRPAGGHPHLTGWKASTRPWPRASPASRRARGGAGVKPAWRGSALLGYSGPGPGASCWPSGSRPPSGWARLEAACALLFPLLLFAACSRGRHAGWTWLSLSWRWSSSSTGCRGTLASKGADCPIGLALLGRAFYELREALGFLAVACGPAGPCPVAGPGRRLRRGALAILVWEIQGFHVYPWSWGAALGGVPWLAKSAAFLGTSGWPALVWGCGAWTGGDLGRGAGPGGSWRPRPRSGSCALARGAWRPCPATRCGSWTWS